MLTYHALTRLGMDEVSSLSSSALDVQLSTMTVVGIAADGKGTCFDVVSLLFDILSMS